VLEIRFLWRLEFGDDALGQDLPQFHSPLIEGIYLPDGAWVKTLCPPGANELGNIFTG
jgi:hypothetical protein